MHIRIFIALMVMAIMLPLVVASAFAVNRIWQEEQRTATASLKKTVETTSTMVDRDIQASLAALRALGNSEHLQTGSYAAFYVQAKAINASPVTWTGLFEADGSQLMNTSLPFAPATGPPPMSALPETIATVHATQKPAVSDIFMSRLTGKESVAVFSPTSAVGSKSYVVAQGFALDYWKNIAQQQELPADWIVAVIDRNGRFISRSHKSDELQGKPARPELVAAAAQKEEGTIRLSTVEGIDSYQAFTHSDLTGWTIAVAAPAQSIDAPGLRAIQIAAAGGLLAILASSFLAVIFGRLLVTALQTANTAAVSLGHGQTPKPVRTSIVEVDAVNQALANAGELLESERDARMASEAQRDRLLEAESLARDAAQKENQAKDHFLAMLGHELRNPVAAISGAVSVLTRGNKSTPDASRYLGIIRRQNRHLVHILDDLLDMSRLIAGKIVLDTHPVDLAESVQSCVDGLKAAQRLDGHTLNVMLEPVWIQADPVRIEQVIINLIGNALKFSPIGTAIAVELHQADGAAVLRVQDHGTGMTPELMAQIFEPFMQGPAPINGPQSGMGVGLALVRHIVELHAGAVTVASGGLGQGSTFTCQFPTIAAPTTEPTSSFDHLMAATARTLLYVEDNADARLVMSEMLRLSGYQVVEAANAMEALAAVALERPDIAVLDVGLPDMNGYELARQIHQLPNGCDLPIIALTGYGQNRDIDAATRAGFKAHLVKPVDSDELTRTIEAVLTQLG